jgi:hypothetical protein
LAEHAAVADLQPRAVAGIVGRMASRFRVGVAGAQAGLPTPSYTQSSYDEIDETLQLRRIVPEGTPTAMAITLGDHVFGPTSASDQQRV